MKVLITGANGFLGHYLTALLLEKKYHVIATGRGECRLSFSGMDGFEYSQMDFTKPAEVNDIIASVKPDVLVHTGAMSRPDECEENQQEAFRINVTGTDYLLQAASTQQCFFIFISTDFIFDGAKGMYSEEDIPGPVNYYGKTKWYAENLVREYPGKYAIARTVLVYGKPPAGRPDILSTVKEKLEKGEVYHVVSDQVRTPTFAEDLAAGICSVIEKKATGTFHLSGEDVLTPYDMACKTAEYLGLDSSLIKKVTAADFSQPAKRPLKTGFTIEKAKQLLDYKPVSFETGLRKTFTDQK